LISTNKLYLSTTVLVPSLASESICSEYACNSMLSQLLIENSTKPFSNSSQTLYCNSEQKEQYNLYKRRKLQEAGIFKILNYNFFFFIHNVFIWPNISNNRKRNLINFLSHSVCMYIQRARPYTQQKYKHIYIYIYVYI